MLAKIYSYLLTMGSKKHVPFTKVLPVKYLYSANLPSEISETEQKARRRALAMQFDKIAIQFASKDQPK